MSILGELAEKRNFSEVETSIADYILQNPDEVCTLGIAELARRTYSSNAAIIRMCRKLGISGYKEFRIAFAVALEKERREQVDVDVNYPFAGPESAASIMRSVADISASAIEDCYASLPQAAMTRVARMMRGAERIYIYAAGDTAITSMGFANMLMKIGHTTVFPTRYLESTQLANGTTKRDVAIIVTYSGVILSSLKRDMMVMRRNKTPIIVISSMRECREADLLLQIPNRESVIGKVAGYYSQTAIRYVLNCLYALVYSLDLEKNREYKDKADSYAYGGEGE